MKVYKTAGGRSYWFGRHALDQMARRNIRQQDVEDTLDNYDIHHNDKRGNDCFIRELKDGRRVRVVGAKDSDPTEVITVIVLD